MPRHAPELQQIIAASRIAGETSYFTGVPCKRGHIAERRLLDNTCIECRKILMHDLYLRRRSSPEGRAKVNKRRGINRLGERGRDFNQRVALKRKNDPQLAMVTKLRGRMHRAVKHEYRGGDAVADLGCSIAEFRNYISAMFVSGMTWSNWGRGSGKWHLDHIKPLALFTLTDRNQFLRAAHYTNYQPLWEYDNVRKGAKYGYL